jgi:hypothetical protein
MQQACMGVCVCVCVCIKSEAGTFIYVFLCSVVSVIVFFGNTRTKAQF